MLDSLFGGCDGGGEQTCTPRIGDNKDEKLTMNVDTVYQFEIVFDNDNKNATFTVKNDVGTTLRTYSSPFDSSLNDLQYYGVVVGRELDGHLTCIDDLTISKYEGKVNTSQA